MNRITKLEELCSRIGIFKRCEKNQIEWGPYGCLLLNQIKSMWLSRNVHKYPNTYLVDSNQKRLDFFGTSLFRGGVWLDNNEQQQPLGLVSVTPGSRPNLSKSPHFLLKGIQTVTDLSVKRIDLVNTKTVEKMPPTIDAGFYWQNERLNWWAKFLNSPENMSVEKFESDEALEPETLYSNLVYRVDDSMSITCERISFSANGKNPLLVNFNFFL